MLTPIVVAATLALSSPMQTSGTDTRYLEVGSATLMPAQSVSIPIYISDVYGLMGIDINLVYDPAVVTAISTSKGPAGAGYVLTSNEDIPGHVYISLYWVGSPPHNKGNLVYIKFMALSPGITKLGFEMLWLNERDVPAEATEGAITVLK